MTTTTATFTTWSPDAFGFDRTDGVFVEHTDPECPNAAGHRAPEGVENDTPAVGCYVCVRGERYVGRSWLDTAGETETERVNVRPVEKPRDPDRTGPPRTTAERLAEVAEWLRELGRKAEVADVTRDRQRAAAEWLHGYTGDFAFLTDLRAKGGVKSAGQAKGVLNCWRAAILRGERPAQNATTVENPAAPAQPATGPEPSDAQVRFLSSLVARKVGPGTDPRTVVADWTRDAVSKAIDTLQHAADAPTAADGTECPEGIHKAADGVIFKVYRAQTSGRLAAKRLVIVTDGGGGERGEFEYAPGAIARHCLGDATRLSHDEAARFGSIHGFCCACGRTLDDERSLKAGYGPKCAERNGWPWGTRQQVAPA